MTGFASYCSRCRSLDYEQMSSPEGQLYHNTFNDLARSASQGCELCAFFIDRRHIIGHLYEIPESAHHLPVRLRIEAITGHHSLRLCLRLSGVEHPPLYALYKTDAVSRDLQKALSGLLPDLRQLMPDGVALDRFEHSREWNRSSDTAVHKMKTWISDCCSSHSNCEEYIGGLPKRILDLGARTVSPDSDIILTDGQGLTGEYVALSHCWGTSSDYNNIKFV